MLGSKPTRVDIRSTIPSEKDQVVFSIIIINNRCFVHTLNLSSSHHHKTKQGHITKSKSSPRKNHSPTSQPALRKGIATTIHANDTTTNVPAPPQLPAMPSGSDSQEDLSNLMMAWYYCGYYTGLYQGQQQQE
ncbi:hypothetical protein MBANPS3_006320 [Mucor bainieri]